VIYKEASIFFHSLEAQEKKKKEKAAREKAAKENAY